MHHLVRGAISFALLASTALSALPATAADAISLRLPWLLNVQSAGYVMAKEKGFYEESGLEVDIMPGGPNLNGTALVASGANTFGTTDVSQVLAGDAQGMDLIMVAACFQKHPAGVISLAESGITKPEDLKGKKLAYNEGGPWVLTKAMLAKAGVALEDIELVVSPSTELLVNKSVDAKTGFTVNEPIAIELQGYPTSIMLPSDYGVQTYAEVIYAKRDYVTQNPDIVRRFVEATIKGYDYAYANQEETVAAIVALNDQLDPAQQAEQLNRQEPFVYTEYTKANGACAMDGQIITDSNAMLIEFGGLETSVDPATTFTTEFIPAKQ